jgi:hypothetical protein
VTHDEMIAGLSRIKQDPERVTRIVRIVIRPTERPGEVLVVKTVVREVRG